jgi:hypothetical protein
MYIFGLFLILLGLTIWSDHNDKNLFTMQSVISSKEFPQKTGREHHYISVEFAGLSSNKEFERALKKIYSGDKIQEIKASEILGPETRAFDDYVKTRGEYESAIQASYFHGIPLTMGDRVELNDPESVLAIVERKAKWSRGRLFIIFKLREII